MRSRKLKLLSIIHSTSSKISLKIALQLDQNVAGIIINEILNFILLYTECPRRNVPDFGRVFLMLKYTDITQNTYVQS